MENKERSIVFNLADLNFEARYLYDSIYFYMYVCAIYIYIYTLHIYIYKYTLHTLMHDDTCILTNTSLDALYIFVIFVHRRDFLNILHIPGISHHQSLVGSSANAVRH